MKMKSRDKNDGMRGTWFTFVLLLPIRDTLLFSCIKEFHKPPSQDTFFLNKKVCNPSQIKILKNYKIFLGFFQTSLILNEDL